MQVTIGKRGGETPEGAVALNVSLELEDLAQLKEQAHRAYEIERSLPAEARTPLGNAQEATYVKAFIETRATSDALEARGIIPAVAPEVEVQGLSSGDLYRAAVHVVARPDIGLAAFDPRELKMRRVPKPGISAKSAAKGDGDAEFVDDEKVLRRMIVDRLDSELPEPVIRALADEYRAAFERALNEHNIDPVSYQLAHGLNEEQYLLMMARNALADARWNYALDAVFADAGLTMGEGDLEAALEAQHPGCADQLVELYELRGELWKVAENVRRAKALDWLRAAFRESVPSAQRRPERRTPQNADENGLNETLA